MSQTHQGLEHTREVRLYPTLEQARLLMAHCQEYISTVNVLTSALDADMLQSAFSTKDARFRTSLSSQKSSLARCSFRLQAFSRFRGFASPQEAHLPVE